MLLSLPKTKQYRWKENVHERAGTFYFDHTMRCSVKQKSCDSILHAVNNILSQYSGEINWSRKLEASFCSFALNEPVKCTPKFRILTSFLFCFSVRFLFFCASAIRLNGCVLAFIFRYIYFFVDYWDLRLAFVGFRFSQFAISLHFTLSFAHRMHCIKQTAWTKSLETEI